MGELIFIGLGLYDEKDISLKGKKAASEADKVYSEFYTSHLAGCTVKDVEEEIGKNINPLSREDIEEKGLPVEKAEEKTVAFLSAGDPMAATTHVDLRLRAEKRGIETKIINSSSIFSAAPSILGVQHYKFGRTVTLPYLDTVEEYPSSPYENIKDNKERGLHSLVLLDIDGEQKEFMDVKEGIKALLHLEERLNKEVITEETLLAGLARVGSEETEVKAGYPPEVMNHDFNSGLHSLVIFGDLHFMEIDSLINLAEAPEDIKEKY